MTNSNERLVINNLREWLTWQAEGGLVREACTIHVGWLYGRIRNWSEPLFTDITRLPKASQQRLLLAPWTYELLQSTAAPTAEQLRKLTDFVAMEQFLAGQLEQAPYEGWTAMTDTHVSPNGLRNARSLGSITFDVESPFTTVGYGDDLAAISSYDPADTESINAVYDKVEDALGKVRDIAGAAYQTIMAAVQVLSVVRGAKENDAFFGSMSAKRVTGRVALVNAHLPKWSACKVADALVHEATHCLIYRLELAHSLYTSDEAANQIRVTSPWSGRSLRLHSFTHACFVWWGLRNFWTLAGAAYEPASSGFLTRAQNGFNKGLLPELLTGEVAAGLQPDVIEAILEIQRLALQKTPATTAAFA